MAITRQTATRSTIFWQTWDDENEVPGESALLINEYDREIEIVQNDNVVLVSRHEIKDFIKHLQLTAKTK